MYKLARQCRRSLAAARHALQRPGALGLPPAASGQGPQAARWLSAVTAAGQDEQRGAAPPAAARATAAAGAASAAAAAAAGPPSSSPRPAAAQQQMAHLWQLSEEQLAAVTAPLGTVRVVAGPGSGKTRVLTARIAQLIHAFGAQPWQVLAITFTNKAANEMRERLAAMLGEEAGRDLFAGTFHSLCYRILKRHISMLPGAGRTQAFTVYDQDMAERLIAGMVRQDFPEWKGRDVNDKAAALAGAISKVKSSMLTWHAPTIQAVVKAVERHLMQQLDSSPSPAEELRARETADWFGRYEEALRRNNAADFDDLLGLAVALLRASQPTREQYLRRFRHVLVDEFQDTNTAQYELVKLLTLPRADLFVVGDPDQSIYGWRGADMANMTHAFTVDFPDAQVLDLRDNYRSSARIVATAAHVIAANDDWLRAGLRPRRPAGHPIEVHALADSHDEARYIAQQIQAALRSGEHPQDQIAVLFRTHIQARLVEQELVQHGIPYVLVGGVPFWRRMEVQDAMAYLRLAVSLRDDVALARIINTPRRGLGDTSVEKLQAFAAARGQTLSSLLFGGMGGSGGYAAGGAGAAGAAGEDAAAGALPQLPDRKDLGLTPKASAALQAFRELMAGLHAAVASQPLGRALDTILAKTGYEQHVRDGGCTSGAAKQGDEEERLARLRQLAAVAADYEPGQLSGAAALDAAFDAGQDLDSSSSSSTGGEGGGGGGTQAAAGQQHSAGGGGYNGLQRAQNFLDEAALYSGADEGGQEVPGVRLLTMHAAKGLEFEMVFVPGCNEGLMPLVRRGQDGADSLAEERRLFYVSMTRAKQRLHLTHTWETSHYGRQNSKESERSQFLSDVLQAGHAVYQEADLLPQSRPGPAYGGSWKQQRYPAGRAGGAGGSRRGGAAGSSGGYSDRRGINSSASSGSSSNSSSQPLAGQPGDVLGSSSSSSSAPPPPLSMAQQRAQRRAGRR